MAKFADAVKDMKLFEWQNFLTGQPTGTLDMGKYGKFSFQGINPGGHILTGDYDWKKAWQGGQTGSNIGGMWGPIGNLIGGGVGASMGGSFVGNPEDSESGLAAASRGNATDVWGKGNDTWKAINSIVDLVNLYKLGQGKKLGGGSPMDWWNSQGTLRQIGYGSTGVNKLGGLVSEDEGNSYLTDLFASLFTR